MKKSALAQNRILDLTRVSQYMKEVCTIAIELRETVTIAEREFVVAENL
jgi:hypothetical protein